MDERQVSSWDRLMGAKDYFTRPLGPAEIVALAIVLVIIVAIAVYILRVWMRANRAERKWEREHPATRQVRIVRALERDTVRTRQQRPKPHHTVVEEEEREDYDDESSGDEPGLHTIVRENDYHPGGETDDDEEKR